MAEQRPVRMTRATKAVLAAILDATEPTWGLQIMHTTRLGSGVVYPILVRLEERGWVEGYWEDVDPAAPGRPRRRYWKLTTWGAWRTREALGRTADA